MGEMWKSALLITYQSIAAIKVWVSPKYSKKYSKKNSKKITALKKVLNERDALFKVLKKVLIKLTKIEIV